MGSYDRIPVSISITVPPCVQAVKQYHFDGSNCNVTDNIQCNPTLRIIYMRNKGCVVVIIGFEVRATSTENQTKRIQQNSGDRLLCTTEKSELAVHHSHSLTNGLSCISFPILVSLTTVNTDAAASETVASIAYTAAFDERMSWDCWPADDRGLNQTSESVSSGWTYNELAAFIDIY